MALIYLYITRNVCNFVKIQQLISNISGENIEIRSIVQLMDVVMCHLMSECILGRVSI